MYSPPALSAETMAWLQTLTPEQLREYGWQAGGTFMGRAAGPALGGMDPNYSGTPSVGLLSGVQQGTDGPFTITPEQQAGADRLRGQLGPLLSGSAQGLLSRLPFGSGTSSPSYAGTTGTGPAMGGVDPNFVMTPELQALSQRMQQAASDPTMAFGTGAQGAHTMTAADAELSQGMRSLVENNPWMASGGTSNPESFRSWLQANNMLTADGQIDLGEYGGGDVIGNSGLYRRQDEGSQESPEAFAMRLYQASVGNGEWGTAGRGFNDLQNAGFVNTLAPVTRDGVQYQRVGENISDPAWIKRFHESTKPDAARYTSQWDIPSIYKNDPEYGHLMQLDKYQEAVRLLDAAKSEGVWAYNSPIPEIVKMIGSAVGAQFLGPAMEAAGIGTQTATGAGSVFPETFSNTLSGFGGVSGAASSLPSSYWNMLADAGGTASDALPAGASGALSGGDSIWSSLYEQAINGTGPFASAGAAGVAGAFDASGIGTGVDAGTMASNAGLGQGVTGTVFPSVAGPTLTNGVWGSLAQKLGTSTLGKILNGTASGDDYLKALGTVGSTALGLYGAERQADALSGTADKYLALGAPFRSRLAESYAPNFDLSKQDPAFKNALDLSSQSVLKNLSTSGNPFDNPGAVTQAQKFVTDSVALPQLNTYRSQLGTFGALGTNTAGTADIAAASNAGSGLDALGYGIGQLTGNSNSFDDLLKKYGGLLGNKGLSLNLGSSL